MMFKEFRVSDLFEPVKVKKYSKKPESIGLIPFVSCQTTNNGISSYCDETPEIKHCITVSTNGNCFDCFWHDYPIIPSIDVEVLSKDGITNDMGVALYLCSVLAPHTQFYSYSNKPKGGKVFNTIIPLPVTPHPDSSHVYTVDDIDWQYMQDTIKELEQDTIKELDTYLKVTGLDDYKLTDEDKRVLSLSRGEGCNQDGSLEDDKSDEVVRYGEFRVGDLFDKKTIKGIPKVLENLDVNVNGFHVFGQNIKYQYPHKVLNDPIYLQCVQPDEPILAYTSSVGEIGMIEESFYRTGNNGAFQGLFPKFKLNRYCLQYILTILKKQFVNFGYATTMTGILDLSIFLPITSSGDIDFDYMESCIKAIQKLVIVDVVKYKDSLIEATKKVVSSSF